MYKFVVLVVILSVYYVESSYSSGYGGHGGKHGIPAAIKSKYSMEVLNVNDYSEPIKEQVIDVNAQPLPITFHFRSASPDVKVYQTHTPGRGDTQSTSSQDEPHKLFHEVNKPIYQEVREVITPYRRIVQEVRPVQEDIQSIVARGSGHRRGGGGGGGGGGGYGGGHSYGGSSGHKY